MTVARVRSLRPSSKFLTVSDVVSREISRFEVDGGGCRWHDAVSWIPRTELRSADRELAYQQIFAAMISRARRLGAVHPVIRSSGTGCFLAVDDSPLAGGSRYSS